MSKIKTAAEDFGEEFYLEYWDKVKLTDEELDSLVEAAERNDHQEADRIVNGAYDRLFGETVN